ncbi:sphingosine-1-phosphate phosphatase [Mycena galericulata]|nr:sphingosine-1-phosphate phosphatase [Mycena galericulata]
MAPHEDPGDRIRSVTFTLSGPPSIASSRAGSPVPSIPSYPMSLKEEISLEKIAQEDPGCRPMDVYDATLPAWRAAVRRKLVASIRVESLAASVVGWIFGVSNPVHIGGMLETATRCLTWTVSANKCLQDAIRSPWLDAYFVHTSALGTHTFFMTFLPMLFFFGYDELGRGLIVVLCLGIYFTSVAKDLFCSPRPFAPPVTRLTIGTHHLEYGMPSTHSANSVSLALFFFAHIHELAFPLAPTTTPPSLSLPAYAALTAGLAVYATSIVFGRLYTAMHSFTDCAVGVLLGVLLWLVHTSFRGLPLALSLPATLARLLHLPSPLQLTLLRGWGWGAHLEAWVLRTPSSVRVPLTLIPLALLAVNQHPQPVDDCPCFEDAIAVGSVVLGMLVGRWGAVRWGGYVPSRGAVMPGSGWVLAAGAAGWVPVERGWGDVGVWWGAAVLKMVFGILTIFAWRLLAKAFLARALPPTFRFLATLMRLPRRRFYTPATDYAGGPPVAALRPIPSVIDLAGSAGVEVGGIGSGSGIGAGAGAGKGNGASASRLMRRRAEAVEAARGGAQNELAPADVDAEDAALMASGGREVKHYDADVLTKLIVYAGIAVIACEVMPVLFERFGWGVRSWP